LEKSWLLSVTGNRTIRLPISLPSRLVQVVQAVAETGKIRKDNEI